MNIKSINLIKDFFRGPKIYKGFTYFSINKTSLSEYTGKRFFTKIINYKLINLKFIEFYITKKALISKKYLDDPYHDDAYDYLIKNDIYFRDSFYDEFGNDITLKEYLEEEKHPTGWYNIDENNQSTYCKYFKANYAYWYGNLIGDKKRAIDLLLLGAKTFETYDKSKEAVIFQVKNENEDYYLAGTKFCLFSSKIGEKVKFGDIGYMPIGIHDKILPKNKNTNELVYQYGWISKILKFWNCDVIEFKKNGSLYRIKYDVDNFEEKYPIDLYDLEYGDKIKIFNHEKINPIELVIPNKEYFINNKGEYTVNTLEEAKIRAQEIIDDINT